MDIAAHVDAIGVQGRLLAAAAASAGLDAAVPSCPDWVVRDLVRHQGGVHRWATGIVAGPRTQAWNVSLDEVVGAWPSDDELLSWFGDGVDRLVEVLSSADPRLDCWTFLAAPSPLAMWARRQAHETSVHRVDAELAAGQSVTPFAAPLAADGISELLTCFITRPHGTLRSDPPKSLRVTCSDGPGDWLVRIGPDQVCTVPADDPPGAAEHADCQVSGSTQDLYLTLWNRRPADGLPAVGDAGVLDLFLDQVHIRWTR
ncbi:MAG TPA: maleylpyruvate isomerase family mycothiol-dependent enzyme [Streptosporangiaceae bacterium]